MKQRVMTQARRGAWPLAAGAMLALALGMWADSAQAAAADEYSTESAKASQSLLIGAAHAGKRLVVVGDRGHILFSDDQGSTWTQAGTHPAAAHRRVLPRRQAWLGGRP